MFIRPHHKRQYKEMLEALTSEPVPIVDFSSMNTDQPQQGEQELTTYYYSVNCLLVISLPRTSNG